MSIFKKVKIYFNFWCMIIRIEHMHMTDVKFAEASINAQFK